MAACAMLTYNNITPAAWQSIRDAVEKYGIAIDGDSGSAEKDGLTIKWAFDQQTQILTLQCAEHPFYLTCSTINGTINEKIETCLGHHNIELGEMIDNR